MITIVNPVKVIDKTYVDPWNLDEGKTYTPAGCPHILIIPMEDAVGTGDTCAVIIIGTEISLASSVGEYCDREGHKLIEEVSCHLTINVNVS
jgi:hypothetical protein